MSLEGKSVIVTGAGRGLGRGSRRCSQNEAPSVMMTGRTPETLESARDEFRATGGVVDFVVGDVGVRDDVEHVVAATVEAYGGIDVLVNNAQSLDTNESVLDVTDESLALPFRSGLFGTLYMMQACHSHLKARGRWRDRELRIIHLDPRQRRLRVLRDDQGSDPGAEPKRGARMGP